MSQGQQNSTETSKLSLIFKSVFTTSVIRLPCHAPRVTQTERPPSMHACTPYSLDPLMFPRLFLKSSVIYHSCTISVVD
jgi:hypothetical protein